jgi:hypothetical protein
MRDIDFAALLEPVARRLWGEPNRKLSSARELRWGSNGSRSVNRAQGTWYDHEATEGGGTLDLIAREAGHTGKDAIDWLEHEHLIGKTNGKTKNGSAGKIVATYDYTDEAGELLFQVVRKENPKTFLQRRPNGAGGWTWKLGDTRRVLFNLPRVIEAVSLEQPIIVCEGEKDCLNLARLNIVATTNPGGAGKWRKEYTDTLRDADVVILPDADEPGRKHAAAVARSLAGTAKRVRLIELPGLPEKGDVSDWLAGGGTADELWRIIESAPDWRSEAAEATPPDNLHWHGEQTETAVRSWLVDGLLPETGTALLAGQWGVFKTFIALDLSGAVMAGTCFINLPIARRGGVLFVAAEGASEIPVRLQAVLETKYPGVGRAPFAWLDACPQLIDDTSLAELEAAAKKADTKMREQWGVPLTLITIDTIVASAGYAKGGDENDAALNQTIMARLAQLSRSTGALVLGIDHFGKNAETGIRGSSAKEGGADVVLAALGERSLAGAVSKTRLAARKRRAGPSGEEFPFTVRVVDLGADRSGKPVTSLGVDWSREPEKPASTAKPDAWSKSLRLLRRTLMNVLATDAAKDMRPFNDGLFVRAIDQEIVRIEFYRSFVADGDAAQKQAAKRQAFRRAMRNAQDRNLIGIREIDAVTFVWLASPSTQEPSA